MHISSKGKSLVTISTEPTMNYVAFQALFQDYCQRLKGIPPLFQNPAAFVLYTNSLKYLGRDGKHFLLTLH